MPHISAQRAFQLLRMTEGPIVNQSLYVTASLGIADLLEDGPRDISVIADAAKVDEQALYRTLRFLAGHGVFFETTPRQFANSELSEWLRSDEPGSMRRSVIFRGSRYFLSAVAGLDNAIATGKPAHDAFERLRQDKEEARIFDDAMTDISAIWAPSIATAYDFGQWGSLMDVGGGNGLLLAAILKVHPHLCGVLADQQHVLARARTGAIWPDLKDRVVFESVDFFHSIPAICRAYLLKNILHDWNDDQALQILRHCRRAVPSNGVLLLVEYSLGPTNTPSLGKAADMIMLASTGGKERTVDEHRELLAAAGFQLENATSIEGDITMLEAKPATS
jgi:O-methyltransferase domain